MSLERVLVIRLSSIGDIVHTLPAVAALGRSFPKAEIHWAIERRFAELLEDNPYVQRRLELNTQGFGMAWEYGKLALRLARPTPQIGNFDYDAVVDFQGLIKTAILAGLSRAPVRIGFARGWLREPAAAVFYTCRVAPNGRRHVVDLNLALAEKLGAQAGALEFPLPRDPQVQRSIEDRLSRLGAGPWVIVHPGAGWKAKRWPPQSYGELIRLLNAEFPFMILLTGSRGEQPLAEEILSYTPEARAKFFPCDLRGFIALARRASLFVGGDTGPMHLAAAVGTPIVAIFDACDPLNTVERNGPMNSDDLAVTGSGETVNGRRNKRRDYLRGVSVESVLAAIRERWRKAYG